MKNLSVVFALAFLLITASSAMAASTTSNSHAQILTAITITNDVPLEFGNIVASAAAGTVTVSAAGVRSALLGATLASGTTATASSFTVTGDSGATYAVGLPADGTTTIDSGANSMMVDTYTSASTGSGTLVGGTDTLTVGATVHVGISQAPGSYTGTFSVSANYN